MDESSPESGLAELAKRLGRRFIGRRLTGGARLTAQRAEKGVTRRMAGSLERVRGAIDADDGRECSPERGERRDG
ncbi:MAG: hypothetical protein ACREKH_02000 [Candidatus Rokuibacteriota bacterium]